MDGTRRAGPSRCSAKSLKGTYDEFLSQQASEMPRGGDRRPYRGWPTGYVSPATTPLRWTQRIS
jgi:hypothetical protein